MNFPFDYQVTVPNLFMAHPITINFKDGLTTFIGPNGSGKSQVLKSIRDNLANNPAYNYHRKVRLVTAGRLSQIEQYRSNFDGQYGTDRSEQAAFGGKHLRDYRHLAESAIGDFHTLSIRPDILIKVSERLSTLFRRNIIIEWDSGELKLKFSSIDGEPYSSAREASGLLHLVAILTALYDDEVGILLLDEPEISLHPQLQSFLFQEIKRVAGHPSNRSKKMIVIATHSTEFLDILVPEDIAKVVFFSNTDKEPIQINSNVGELQSRKVRELLTRLGHAHKTAFFSLRPLLIEGPSDQLICNTLNQHLGLYLEAGGSQLVPVIGKGELPSVIKLMRLIGKKPVVMTDLDTFVDDVTIVDIFSTDSNLINKLQEHGHGDLISFSRSIYTEYKRVVDTCWTHISNEAELHNYWIQRQEENLAKKRTVMATLFNLEDDQILQLQNGRDFLAIKKRLSFLFDTLELAGCFILRKGTIEDYYQTNITTNKLQSAIEEVQHILTLPKEVCFENYSDIVRALQFAASTEEIDERKIIADYLLAVISPAIVTMDSEKTDSELQSNAKRIVGEISSIFKLSKVERNGSILIRVELNSNIIDAQGFPIDFPLDRNPIEIVKNSLYI